MKNRNAMIRASINLVLNIASKRWECSQNFLKPSLEFITSFRTILYFIKRFEKSSEIVFHELLRCLVSKLNLHLAILFREHARNCNVKHDYIIVFFWQITSFELNTFSALDFAYATSVWLRYFILTKNFLN